MCMIAYRPIPSNGYAAGIPTDVVSTALDRHPDGYGLAWRENSAVKFSKFGPDQRPAFRKALERVDRAGFEYMAHFRQATHGPAVKRLAHPFSYEDAKEGTVVVMHNGVISICTDAQESDTQVFVRDVLAHLPTGWWRMPAMRYLVSQSIGWSRLVVMTARETVNLQERDGKWDGGLWYSSNHKPTPVNAVTPWKPTATGKATGTLSGKGQERGTYDAATGTYVSQDGTVYPIKPEQMSGVATPAPSFPAALAASSGIGRDVDKGRVLTHGGHVLSAVTAIDFGKDGDWPESVMCDTCYTQGDLYVIDGSYYVDMGHKFGVLEEVSDDEEAASLLADESEDLLPEPVVVKRMSRKDRRIAVAQSRKWGA